MSDLADLKKAELVALCEEKGLDTEGTKADLIARLEASQAPAAEAPAEEVEEEVAEEPAVEEAEPEPAPKPKAKKGSVPDPADESLSTVEFIEAAYLSLLGREADRQGLRHYKNGIDIHQTIDRQRVLDDLLASEEYRNQ